MADETLDLHPNKWDYNKKLKAVDISNWNSTPYIENEYAIQPEKKPFKLARLLYDGKRIEGIIPNPIMVKSVSAFYDSEKTKLLAFYFYTGKKYHYYANQNTDVDATKTTFTAFSLDNKPEITITRIFLESIHKNDGIDMAKLAGDRLVSKELFRDTDIIFDLDRHPNGNLKDKEIYQSYTNGANVVIDGPKPLGNKFVSVSYVTNPFTVFGIKFKNKNITVEGGFPDVMFTEFDVHYRKDDHSYDDPLLIILRVESLYATSLRIVGRYFLSKDSASTIWNALKVAGFKISDEDIEKVLDNIQRYRRLQTSNLTYDLRSRLRDGTIDLIIDIEMVPKNNQDIYKYSGKTVHYKRESIEKGYFSVEHAHMFQTFTIKEVKTKDKCTFTVLPSNKTLVSLFKVYFNEKIDGYPLLICLVYDGKFNWLRRYYRDTKWAVLVNENLVNGENKSTIKRILDASCIPNVAIDLQEKGPKIYKPIGNSLPFKITMERLQNSNYYKFRHSRVDNKTFKIKSIRYGTKELRGMNLNVEWTSISAYYWGTEPLYDRLMVVQLGDKDEDCYSYGGDNEDWIQTGGSFGTTILELLDSANCERQKAHIIDLGSTNIYGCPGCATGIEMYTIAYGDYSCYEHTIAGKDSYSISNFKDGDSYDTGIPAFINFHTVYVYRHIENFDVPFLIYVSGYNGEKNKGLHYRDRWYQRVSRTSKKWIKVKRENVPKSYTERPDILKILNEIQGNKIVERENVKNRSHQRNIRRPPERLGNVDSSTGLDSRDVRTVGRQSRDNPKQVNEGTHHGGKVVTPVPKVTRDTENSQSHIIQGPKVVLRPISTTASPSSHTAVETGSVKGRISRTTSEKIEDKEESVTKDPSSPNSSTTLSENGKVQKTPLQETSSTSPPTDRSLNSNDGDSNRSGSAIREKANDMSQDNVIRGTYDEKIDIESKQGTVSTDSGSQEHSTADEDSDQIQSNGDSHVSPNISDWFKKHAITIGSAGTLAVVVPTGITTYCCIKNRKV